MKFPIPLVVCLPLSSVSLTSSGTNLELSKAFTRSFLASGKTSCQQTRGAVTTRGAETLFGKAFNSRTTEQTIPPFQLSRQLPTAAVIVANEEGSQILCANCAPPADHLQTVNMIHGRDSIKR